MEERFNAARKAYAAQAAREASLLMRGLRLIHQHSTLRSDPYGALLAADLTQTIDSMKPQYRALSAELEGPARALAAVAPMLAVSAGHAVYETGVTSWCPAHLYDPLPHRLSGRLTAALITIPVVVMGAASFAFQTPAFTVLAAVAGLGLSWQAYRLAKARHRATQEAAEAKLSMLPTKARYLASLLELPPELIRPQLVWALEARHRRDAVERKAAKEEAARQAAEKAEAEQQAARAARIARPSSSPASAATARGSYGASSYVAAGAAAVAVACATQDRDDDVPASTPAYTPAYTPDDDPYYDDYYSTSLYPDTNTNGLPMIADSGIDVGGNVYGSMDW